MPQSMDLEIDRASGFSIAPFAYEFRGQPYEIVPVLQCKDLQGDRYGLYHGTPSRTSYWATGHTRALGWALRDNKEHETSTCFYYGPSVLSFITVLGHDPHQELPWKTFAMFWHSVEIREFKSVEVLVWVSELQESLQPRNWSRNHAIKQLHFFMQISLGSSLQSAFVAFAVAGDFFVSGARWPSTGAVPRIVPSRSLPLSICSGPNHLRPKRLLTKIPAGIVKTFLVCK
jgi:hypothetical protein